MIECFDVTCIYHPLYEPFCNEDECQKYDREGGILKEYEKILEKALSNE